MSNDQNKKKAAPPAEGGGRPHDDPQAMKLAETTDVSPGQARELLRKHGKEEAEKRARDFKAEG